MSESEHVFQICIVRFFKNLLACTFIIQNLFLIPVVQWKTPGTVLFYVENGEEDLWSSCSLAPVRVVLKTGSFLCVLFSSPLEHRSFVVNAQSHVRHSSWCWTRYPLHPHLSFALFSPLCRGLWGAACLVWSHGDCSASCTSGVGARLPGHWAQY